MSAIYQRARPITFAQVVGQDHVKGVLKAALERGRIGHAYLFSGPRGVGKTTTARLLAMAVNCENEDVSARPCGECESCLLVRKGNHPDVIELDAASNNSVDDIRDLREKVRLAPMRGGKRVWVLDEAHMLTRSASNALLKTLEEPPPNLVFILATTEPEKLPPTILSRTQHFRFRRLSEVEIAGKLERLCEEADVAAEKDALTLVAKAADGAMRDAESLLERLLTSGEAITQEDAEAALGLPPQSRLQSLAKHLINRDLNALFSEASGLYADGFAPRSLAERLKLTLREALYTAVGLTDEFRLDAEQDDLLRVIHALDDESERFVRYDDLFSLEVSLIKAMNALSRNAPSDAVADLSERSPSPNQTRSAPPAQPSGLPDFDPVGRTPSAPLSNGAAQRVQNTANQQAPNQSAQGQSASGQSSSRAQGSTPQPESAPRPVREVNWRNVQSKASAQLKAFLLPAKTDIDGQDIYLRFADTHKFHFGQLKSRQGELVSLVSEVLGGGFTLHVEGPGESLVKKS